MALTHGANDPARKKGKKAKNNKSAVTNEDNERYNELKDKDYTELLDMANEGQPEHEKFAKNTAKIKLIEAIMAKTKTD